MYPDFIDSVADKNTKIIEILVEFTSVCQPLDVGIIKSY